MTDATGQSVGTNFVPGFRANLNLLPQQSTSRLLRCVDADLNYSEPGQYFNADDVGTSDPEDETTRIADSPDGFVDMYRRFGTFKGFRDGKWIEKEDLLRMLADPTSKIMMAMRAGQGRKRDTAIIAAMTAAPILQDKGQNYVAGVALPAGQIIAHDFTGAHEDETLTAGAGGGYGLTIGKILRTRRIISNSEIDEEAPGQTPTDMYWATTAAQIEDLLKTIPATSKWYSQAEALAAGTINNFAGFEFIRLGATAKFNPLPKTSYTRSNFAWKKQALIYRARPVVDARITERADKSFNWYAFYRQEHGAFRRYDEGVVQINCDEDNNTAYN